MDPMLSHAFDDDDDLTGDDDLDPAGPPPSPEPAPVPDPAEPGTGLPPDEHPAAPTPQYPPPE